MNTNSHFVIVWDCDAAGKAEALREDLPRGAKVTPFAFEKREENTIAPKGIENVYDEEILEPWSTTTRNHEGAIVARSFPKNRKTAFANDVLQRATPKYFVHFQDLHAIISRILGSTSATTLTGSNGEQVDLAVNGQARVDSHLRTVV